MGIVEGAARDCFVAITISLYAKSIYLAAPKLIAILKYGCR